MAVPTLRSNPVGGVRRQAHAPALRPLGRGSQGPPHALFSSTSSALKAPEAAMNMISYALACALLDHHHAGLRAAHVAAADYRPLRHHLTTTSVARPAPLCWSGTSAGTCKKSPSVARPADIHRSTRWRSTPRRGCPGRATTWPLGAASPPGEPRPRPPSSSQASQSSTTEAEPLAAADPGRMLAFRDESLPQRRSGCSRRTRKEVPMSPAQRHGK